MDDLPDPEYSEGETEYRIAAIEYRNYQFMGCYVNFKDSFDLTENYRGREYHRITPASMGRLKRVINRRCYVKFETEDIYTPVIVATPIREREF